jgi:hypothetical protein
MEMRYDKRDNLIYKKNSEGLELEIMYDSSDKIITVINRSKNEITSFQYDSYKREVLCKSSLGFERNTKYIDDMVFVKDSNGLYEARKLDKNGKVLYFIGSNGYGSNKYDEYGHKIYSINACGIEDFYTYRNEKLIEHTNSTGFKEEYSYNHGLPSYYTNSNGVAYNYLYDDKERLIVQTDSTTGLDCILYEYDEAGHLLKINRSGEIDERFFNEKGQKIKEYESVFVKYYEYDENGNLTHYKRIYKSKEGL